MQVGPGLVAGGWTGLIVVTCNILIGGVQLYYSEMSIEGDAQIGQCRSDAPLSRSDTHFKMWYYSRTCLNLTYQLVENWTTGPVHKVHARSGMKPYPYMHL